jgi:hypothetical protein
MDKSRPSFPGCRKAWGIVIPVTVLSESPAIPHNAAWRVRCIGDLELNAAEIGKIPAVFVAVPSIDKESPPIWRP